MSDAKSLALSIAHHVTESGVTDPNLVIEALTINIVGLAKSAPDVEQRSGIYAKALISIAAKAMEADDSLPTGKTHEGNDDVH